MTLKHAPDSNSIRERHLHFIYLITNKINDKAYIGQTSRSVEERWKEHVKLAGYEDYALSRAIRKYGSDSFFVEEMSQVATKEEADRQEVLLIKLFKANNSKFGYNQTRGGEGFAGDHTEETKQAISEALIGNQYHKGVLHSEETKERIRQSVKDAYASGNHKRGTGLKKGTILGPMPAEARAKISETMKKVRAERPWSTKKKPLDKHLPKGDTGFGGAA